MNNIVLCNKPLAVTVLTRKLHIYRRVSRLYIVLLIPAFVAILLFIAILPLGYDFYTFLRFVVFFVAGSYTIFTFNSKYKILSIVYGFAVIMFNPFFPFHLSKDIWIILDITYGIIFLLTSLILIIQKMNKVSSSPIK